MFSVTATSDMVWAWSQTRLAFEPRGWQRDFREQLRTALRNLASASTTGLLAEYDGPDDAFVDVENVLLYNVGMSVFGPLIGAGLTCRRGYSTDGRHHMRYQRVDAAIDPGGTGLFGMVTADLGDHLPSGAAGWWARLRPMATAPAGAHPGAGSFTADVVLAGPKLTGTRLAGLVKPMLDGLVSCFHAHDGSHADLLCPPLATLGPPAAVWAQLRDASVAALGVRPLVRPYRQGLLWNPADERCRAFRVRGHHAPRWSLHAELRQIPG